MTIAGDNDKGLFLQKLEEEQKSGLKPPDYSAGNSFQQQGPHNPNPSRKISAIALFVTTFLMFLIVVALLILALSVNTAGSINPVLQFFGQNEDTVKTFLLNLVNMSFGFFSVFLLITITVTFFIGFSVPRENRQRRATSFLFAFVSLGLQFVTILAWLGMFNFVSKLYAETNSKKGEIILILPDGSQIFAPLADEMLQGVSAPVNLQFSAEDILAKYAGLDKTIRRFAWDLGTGKYEDIAKQEQVVTKRFSRAGRHIVRLRLDFAKGDTEFIEKQITFTIPRANLAAEPESGPVPLTVRFDASNVAAPIPNAKDYEWYFEDADRPDFRDSGPVATHKFTKIGENDVKLLIYDSAGRVYDFHTVVFTTEPIVGAVSPVINTDPFISDEELKTLDIAAGTEVTFSGIKSSSTQGQITKYEWFFPDKLEAVMGETVKFTFHENGDFPVVLKTTDNTGLSASATITVSVLSNTPPVADFLTNPRADETGKISGIIPFVVNFDATGSTDLENDIVAYDWDFDGDGQVDEHGSQLGHVFEKPGTFVVTLIVIDQHQNQNTKQITVKTEEKKLAAAITAEPETATVPCEVSFTGSLVSCPEGKCEVSGYTWNFGDGFEKQYAKANIRHSYKQIGDFVVKLIVYTTAGENVTAKQTVYCRETPLTACFKPSRTRSNVPMNVSFDPACSTGKIKNYEWDFGDGSTSMVVVPTHSYLRPGKYTVSLKVSSEDNVFESTTAEIIAEE